jgi:hypothetical protein
MCDKVATSICNQCHCSRYCSKTCQEDDWPVHKILCRSFANYSDAKRPGSNGQSLTRGIYFPTERKKPQFVWVLITTNPDGTYDIKAGELQPRDRALNYVGYAAFKYNKVLKRSHNYIGLVSILDKGGKKILADKPNTSTAKIDAELTEWWKAPLVFHAMKEDLDMMGFRHIVDWMRTDFEAARRRGEHLLEGADGVRLNCNGDINISGRPEIEPCKIPRSYWPAFEEDNYQIPIAEKLGFPLRHGGIQPELSWRGRRLLLKNIACNAHLIDLNPAQWTLKSGSTVVVHRDEKPLHVVHLQAPWLYCTMLAQNSGHIQFPPLPHATANDPDPVVSHLVDPHFQARASYMLANASKEKFLVFWRTFMEEGGQKHYGDVKSPYDV